MHRFIRNSIPKAIESTCLLLCRYSALYVFLLVPSGKLNCFRHRLKKILLALLFIACGQSAYSEAAVELSCVMCRNQKIVRTIKVLDKKDLGCETLYTKAGVDRNVGEGQVKGSCFKILNNIKSNLEKASWSCRDIQNCEVTKSSGLKR